MTEQTPVATTTTTTRGPRGLAVASLVLGIVSTVFGVWILPIVFLFVGIVGVVLGFVSRSREPGARGIATVGIILSFVGIIASVVGLILSAIIVANVLNN